MSLQNIQSVPRHSRGFRGNRLAQPSGKRETLKPPKPDTTNFVAMPDGGRICPDAFHRLRSNSHKVLGGDLAGCAKRMLAFATPLQKTKIESWLRAHRNRKAQLDTANDHLMAVLLDYAGSKMSNKLNGFSVYALVSEIESVHMIVPPG